jgi:hypothetical protein
MKLKEIFNENEFLEKFTDYIIREIRAGSNEFEVTKFMRGKAPKEIYRCVKGPVKWTCTCPSKIKPCKHINMVKKWISDGKKSFIDDKAAIEYSKELFGRK